MGLLSYYLRVFIRSHFKPMTPERAKSWTSKTSIMYFVLAWSAFGYTIYAFVNTYEENQSNPNYRGAMVTDPYTLMKKFGTKPNFTLYTLSGTKVEKEVYSLQDIDKKIAETKENPTV